MTDTRANIETADSACVRECCRTFRHDGWGAALDGGPFPGTKADPGDVRRCEHGRIWLFVADDNYGVDLWRQISRFWEPFRYRRAARALSAPTPSGGTAQPGGAQ